MLARRGKRFSRAAVALVAALLVAVTAEAASAAVPYELRDGAQSVVRSGLNADRGGGHPDLDITLGWVTEPAYPAVGVPGQATRRLVFELPPGLVGDPTAVQECGMDLVLANESSATVGMCPRGAAVGWFDFESNYPNGNNVGHLRRRVWRVPARPNEAAAFATSVIGIPIRMAATVSPAGGYRVRVVGDHLPQTAALRYLHVHLWGVPADHQADGGAPPVDYDGAGGPADCDGNFPLGGGYNCFGGGSPGVRFGSPLTGVDRKPFLTNASVCDTPTSMGLSATPWGTVWPGQSETVPFAALEGCELQPFVPSIALAPTTRKTGAPSGYTVGIDVAQANDPNGQAAAQVKDVEVSLPDGVAISPSSANGLAACSDEQLDIDGDSEPQCPSASRLGSVTVDSPVLEERLQGAAYVGTQKSQDPQSGEMYRLFLVVKGPGVLVKLAGAVKADPATGRLTARFENNPQLPFERIELHLDDGQRASLANPNACGSYDTNARLVAWSGKAADLTAAMTIDQDCGPRGFSPSFKAGSDNPVAGETSAFSAVVARDDSSQDLRTLDEVKLPKGLLGYVSKVAVCADADADAGSCGEGSRIGRVQVAAGPGGSPLWVPQDGKAPTSVSLAGPYKGAPYSLSVVVPAQAGPFDLGRIVVRAPLDIDRLTAQLSTRIDVARVFDTDGRLDQVVEGGMPTIVKGVPLHVREIRVLVDRAGFTVNPTSCNPASIDATLGSDTGEKAAVTSRFQVGDCQALGFAPRLGMRFTGKHQTRTGTHPGLAATLRQAPGHANIAKARVVLPKSVVLDPSNSTDPALVCDYDEGRKGNCSSGSVIGKATAVSPLLGKPLTGAVHLVQGIRFGPTGNRIRTTPSLLVKLRGDVAIDLYGRTTVSNNRLVTTFDEVPDAAVSRFDIKINGGKKGILVITRTRKAKIGLCAKPGSHRVAIAFNGQNGKRVGFASKVKTPCAAKVKRKAKNSKK